MRVASALLVLAAVSLPGTRAVTPAPLVVPANPDDIEHVASVGGGSVKTRRRRNRRRFAR